MRGASMLGSVAHKCVDVCYVETHGLADWRNVLQGRTASGMVRYRIQPSRLTKEEWMELRLCGVSETITRVVGGEVETACRTHSAHERVRSRPRPAS